MKLFDTYRVCNDCRLATAGYDKHDLGRPFDREPLALIPAGVDVVNAFPHSAECTEADREEGCDCDDLGFSHSACEGCGNPLAGDRYGVTGLVN